MKSDRKSDQDIDRLLLQTLRDDLPPETESRLRERVAAFRCALRPSADPRSARSAGLMKSLPLFSAWHHVYLVYRKEVLAYAAAAMLIAGVVIHLGGFQNLMADSISQLKMSLSFEERVRLASSMDCVITVPATGARDRIYHIRWVREGRTRVDIVSPSDLAETLWIAQSQVTRINPGANSARGAANQATILEGEVAAFLSPADLAGRLDRYWQLQPDKQQHRSDRLLYVDRQDQAVIEVRLDRTSFLPVSLKRVPSRANSKGGMEVPATTAEFLWNKTIEPELMVPRLKPGR